MSNPDRTGLFGPDSITWRVHAEPVLWVGGLRALFLQATHPVGVSGVLRHSDFRADPWGRLMRTAHYVGTVTFGSLEEIDAIGSRVRSLHDKVAGHDPRTGAHYRAGDPDLLRWVHCCEVDSFMAAYLRAGNRLDAAEIDRYFCEQRLAAGVVGLSPDEVPGSAAEMAAYFTSMRPALSVDWRTRRIAALIALPPMPARVRWLTPARPAWATAAICGFALLPTWARRMYGAPGFPTTDLAATVALHGLSTAARFAPGKLREGPHLREARERVA